MLDACGGYGVEKVARLRRCSPLEQLGLQIARFGGYPVSHRLARIQLNAITGASFTGKRRRDPSGSGAGVSPAFLLALHQVRNARLTLADGAVPVGPGDR